jgi:chemotaxis-related protein WspD
MALEPEAPVTSLHEWAHMLAQAHAAVRAADTISVLIFRLHTAWLGLPTWVCKEVAELRAIHTLPHRSGRTLLGLVNIRGELQMCMSLSQLLGLEHTQASGETLGHQAYKRLVVVEQAQDRWVFLVDAVHGVYDVPQDALQAVPDAEAARPFMQGMLDWQGQEVGYLDPVPLFAALHREIL